MEKSEQVWNVLLHYAKPLTDEAESESAIMSDDLNDMHKDIMAVIEGKETIHAQVKKELPKPKVRSRSSVERSVQEMSKVEKAVGGVSDVGGSSSRSDKGQADHKSADERRPWWKIW